MKDGAKLTTAGKTVTVLPQGTSMIDFRNGQGPVSFSEQYDQLSAIAESEARRLHAYAELAVQRTVHRELQKRPGRGPLVGVSRSGPFPEVLRGRRRTHPASVARSFSARARDDPTIRPR